MTWRYFLLEEFRCRHCGKNDIDPAFVSRLDELRHRLGFPLIVNSGYRCPDHNATVSTTGRSGPHTRSAVDLKAHGSKAHAIVREATAMGFTGIGVKQHGPHALRFVHLDDLPDATGQPRPTVWSYP